LIIGAPAVLQYGQGSLLAASRAQSCRSSGFSQWLSGFRAPQTDSPRR